jgi:hypothetical protein
MCKSCAAVLLETGHLSVSHRVIEALQTSALCSCGGRLAIRTLWLPLPRTAYTSSDLQSMLRATLSPRSARVRRPAASAGGDGSGIRSILT